jgi:hypothetical protein
MASNGSAARETLQGEALGTSQAYQPEGRWWWRRIVVVIVCKELSHDLHELSLGFHQLLHLILRSAMWRHLLGLK